MLLRFLGENLCISHIPKISKFCVRLYCKGSAPERKGLVVGIYDNLELTKAAEKVDNETGGRLKSAADKLNLKLGKTEVFHCLLGDYHAVALVGLGPKSVGDYDEIERRNECKENVRKAVAKACRKLQKLLIRRIDVETMGAAEAAAESSILAVWQFQDLKNKKRRKQISKIYPFEDTDKDLWKRGVEKAKAQNFARMLEQCPSNIMTPTHFVQCAIDKLCPMGIQVEARDFNWMQTTKMFAFLTLAQGSCEPPLFLEMAYCGGNPEDKPVLMVGKGVTFDSGGLCLNRDCKGMMEYSADMAGAAVVAGVFKALAALKVKINCNAIIPLCENMPGGNAAMPGLVVTALNGKTIRIDNTFHDGRAFVIDALIYADRYKPHIVINVATLNEGLRFAMGSGASGCFTKSDILWKALKRAGAETGDRLWRLPIWRHYKKKITRTSRADYVTVGKGKGGDPCTAAALFQTFAPKCEFIHVDITGTGRLSSGIGTPYLRKKLMTGRPVRTLFEFINSVACKDK